MNAWAATRARKKYCIPLEFFLYPMLAAPKRARHVAAAPGVVSGFDESEYCT